MFYLLTAQLTPSDVTLVLDDETLAKYAACSEAQYFMPSLVPVATVVAGSVMPDLLETSVVAPLASCRFLTALCKSGVRSWTAYPVRVINCPNNCDLHFALRATGTCGHIDDSRSTWRRIQKMGSISWRKINAPMPLGLYFSTETWDGTEMFTAQDTRLIFVTPSLKAFLEGANLKGVEFVAQEDALNTSLLGQVPPGLAPGQQGPG